MVVIAWCCCWMCVRGIPLQAARATTTLLAATMVVTTDEQQLQRKVDQLLSPWRDMGLKEGMSQWCTFSASGTELGARSQRHRALAASS